MKTTMKAGEILALVSVGAHAVSAKTLDTKSRFRIFSFKDALVKAAEELEKKERALLPECGIDDPQAFDRRLNELRSADDLTEEEAAELDGMTAKLGTLSGLRQQLREDDVTLDIKPIDCAAWFALRDENPGKDGHDPLPDWAERLLFGKLWTAPEDAPEQPETTE